MNQLGITANYAGFHYVSHAVLLITEDTSRLLWVTKRLYPEVAKKYHTSWQRVERDIRTVIAIAWETNRLLLEALAGRHLDRRPQPSQFLAALATAVLAEEAIRRADWPTGTDP